ncbi:T9SS type A sorting domain-containing protein [Chryseosolibacter indicus]|uniref:T9SS type A sorting domain-containing protein n=1 Tax=Chryseosolibacter indicus TaxID=2782351 RepID=A0ABS5VLI0_9BACT|nr:T9SS type A sorting domain-containing protein [Chryseosolibacter indicus]MBT1702302.1 T9SS type A sorting domain-containing protein [Chryseosolibacter indicus]
MLKQLTYSIPLLLCFILNSVQSKALALYTYTGSGANGFWNDANTWTTDPTGVTLTGSTIPGNNDIVTILNGFTVTLNSNVTTLGLTININNGGTLDLSTFTFPTINNLSGSGTLKIKGGYFPTITTNSFLSNFATGATVEFYDFTGSLPVSTNYPNLTFSNSTGVNQTINLSNATAYNLTVFGNLITRRTGAGTLTVKLGTQATNVINTIVNGNVSIGANTTLGVGSFNAVHKITIYGNFTNNGSVRLSNDTQYIPTDATNTGAASLSFTGATDNFFTCNGITNLYTLTVDKGLNSTNILSVTSNNTANLNFYFRDKLINILRGTLKLGSNIDIPRLYGNGSPNYDLGSTTLSPMLWVDGATVNSNGSALVVYGKFRITNGSFTTIGGEGSVIREEGQYMIEGGTFTTEKFRPSSTATTHRGSFIMTGGVFNSIGTTGSDASYSRFSLPYPEQVFIMSGGTINIKNSQNSTGILHIGCNPSNYNITGGAINVILSGTSAAYNMLSTAPLWNFSITRDASVTPTTVTINNIGSLSGAQNSAQPLVIQNDFIIDGANNPVFNPNNLNLTIGRNFIINAGATYTPGTNTTIFNGTADQSFSNSGTITSGLNNLSVNKLSGTLTLGGSATTYLVRQNLTLSQGILNDGGKTLQVNGNIHNEAVHSGTGNITLNGPSTQVISGNGSGTFGNVVLNNANIPGARLTADIAISGTLTLAGIGNSLFDIESYQLWLTSPSATALTTSGSGFTSSKMIRTLGLQSDKGLKKTFGNLSAFTYHFGSGSDYTPATIQLTSVPTGYGSVAIKPVNSRHPFVVASNTRNLLYYWKVVSSGFTGFVSANHEYQYQASKVSPGNDDVNYIPARYNNTTWTEINDLAKVNEASKLILFTNVNYLDGDFTAGIPAAFDIVRIFYSIRDGNWNDVNPATTPWSTQSHTGTPATVYPSASDQVIIGDGATFNHYIAITNNNQLSGGLEINSGSTLDIGTSTGHNFGRLENIQISGSGLMRISSATPLAEFPAGDFGLFIRQTGGTVEYYTTGSQNFNIPTNSISPTNLPLITYRNLILKPSSGTSITMPNQDMLIFETISIQGTSPTAIARLNSIAETTLTVNGNIHVQSGNLEYENETAQTVSVDGNVTINTNAIFDVLPSGTPVNNTLIIKGNLINNGVFDMSVTGSRYCNTTFTGTANTSITGTGSITDFNILTISKGSSQTPILNVNAAAFSLSGGGLPLILSSGTFRLTSNQTVTIANGGIFNIPSTSRLSANGGILQLTGGNGIDMRLAGTLEVLNGAIHVGTTSNDNSIEYAATGSPTINISGGALTVKSQIRRSTASTQGGLLYNQSGGIVTVADKSAISTTRGVFEILNPGSSFTLTNGTLRILRGSGSTSISDLYLFPSSYNVTGGTLEIGTTETLQAVDINTIVPLYNLTVNGTNNIARLEFNPLTLLGTLNISATNVFNANTLNVNISGNFINSNTDNLAGVSAGGFRAGAGTQTTTFNGSTSHQTISGVSGNLTNFSNLIISNTFSGGIVSLLNSTNLRVSGTLTLANGILAGEENTITTLGTVSNSSTHTSTGVGSIILAGSANQLITGNGNGKFGNLTLNNASGASFGANQEVTGILTFANGSLFIGQYGLNISNTSLTAINNASPTRYIITSGLLSNAGVSKAFAPSVTNGNFVFPIGVGGKYTPANYTLTTGVVGGTITVTPVNSKHPSATGSGTAYINYYWHVTHSVIVLNSLVHRYTYVAADEQGTVTDYRDARFKGGAWTIGVTSGNPNTTTRVITFTNTDLAGDYTAGEATAFVNPTTYTSIVSGNWESDATWDIDPPGTNLGPPQGSFVVISQTHTVTMTNNAKRMATLEVRGRLHLGNTTGHDFGIITTSGTGERTIQIQSSTFPSGDFSSFTAQNGGTIEYNGTVILPTQNIYNNLSFSGSGAKTLPNADLTINGNITISAGTVSSTVNNRSIVMINPNGDFTNQSIFTSGSGAIIIGRNLINSGSGASFTAGNGDFGLLINGSLINNSNGTFIAGADSIGIRGNFNNSATFSGGIGAIRVNGNFNNTAGTYTGSTGKLNISGSLTNNANYNAGSGATTIKGSFINSGSSALYQANGNTMNIFGNFTNNSGAVFNANSSSILLSGSWNNSSTFNAGSGTVAFINSLPQTISGSTTFFNIAKTNGGPLTLNNSINANGTLTLTSGNIITANNTISLTNTSIQPVTGNSSSFIDGKLSISFPNTALSSRTFPLGKGTSYRPITIFQGSSSTSPVVRAETINSAPTGSFPATIERLSEARYYAVDLISGILNSPTLEISFNTNPPTDENITVPGNVHILRSVSPGGPWVDAGGSGVFSPSAPSGYATSDITSLANPTYFTLGYQNAALPITLYSFEAILKNSFVALHWITLQEINNATFFIERSENGKTFEPIGTVDGAGNSKELRHYNHTDTNPLLGISYYRLKQTDFDGNYTYSKVVKVFYEGDGSLLTVYPNPSYNVTDIRIKASDKKTNYTKLVITSTTGKVYYSGYVDFSTEIQLKDLKLNYGLSSGTYIISVFSENLKETRKVIIY